jgi:colicin import membrane protein
MRDRQTRTPWAKTLAVLLMLPPAPFAIADDDAAHRLAETFAGTQSGAVADPEVKARREAAARKTAEAVRRAFEAQRAARQRADEAEMLDRARAEAPARETAEPGAPAERIAENARVEAARRAEAARRTAEELRQAREAKERRRAETERAEEARELAEKLRSTRDAEAERIVREAEAEAAAPRNERLEPQEPVPEAVPLSPSHEDPPPSAVHDQSLAAERPRADGSGAASARGRATVLLVLEPGNRGIRRWNKTADPMLCFGETCYVSTGAASPATVLTRTKAFGPGVALGSRAGACRNALGCVFRAIKLDHSVTAMQPIDLRILRHDRRELREVAADETCRLTRGVLSCRAPVRADTYRAWIVPEDLAELAGPEALAAAVASGLPDEVSIRR